MLRMIKALKLLRARPGDSSDRLCVHIHMQHAQLGDAAGSQQTHTPAQNNGGLIVTIKVLLVVLEKITAV